MIFKEDWENLEIGDCVYTLKDIYSYSDEYGNARYAKARDKLIVRGFSHENITDGTGFYADRDELSLMLHFDYNFPKPIGEW